MSFYRDRIVPHLVNWTCGTAGLERWREQACQGLSGVVVEIGFGTGLNVPFYPRQVELVYAVEPSSVATKLAAKRIARSAQPIKLIGLDGQSLPLAEESCDSALMTFTLCTIPNAPLALQEILRVLRPGGQLHFLEHGKAPDASTARWQERWDPLQKRVAAGCHLTRDPLELIGQGGFDSVWVEQRFARGPRPWSYFSVGVARKPSITTG